MTNHGNASRVAGLSFQRQAFEERLCSTSTGACTCEEHIKSVSSSAHKSPGLLISEPSEEPKPDCLIADAAKPFEQNPLGTIRRQVELVRAGVRRWEHVLR